MGDCTEPGCTATAAVRLHVPGAAPRAVCPAHARALVQEEGVVAEPIDGEEDQWP